MLTRCQTRVAWWCTCLVRAALEAAVHVKPARSAPTTAPADDKNEPPGGASAAAPALVAPQAHPRYRQKRRANRDAPPTSGPPRTSKRTKSANLSVADGSAPPSASATATTTPGSEAAAGAPIAEDVGIAKMNASELRAELGKLGRGEPTGATMALVARLRAAIKAQADAPDPLSAGASSSSSRSSAGPRATSSTGAAAASSVSPDPVALLAAFDFELSQELKARLLGRKAMRLVFKRRYDLDFSIPHLFARAIRVFGCVRQDHALASEQALAVLSAELPDLVVRKVRQFVGHGETLDARGHLVWDPGVLAAAGLSKKKIRSKCTEYLCRPAVSPGNNGTLRMSVENTPGWSGNQRAQRSIVAMEGGDLKAAAARARATLGLTSVDSSTPHTLTIKVKASGGYWGDAGHVIGLMQVPSDASVESLPKWIHKLEAGEDDWEYYGYEILRVVDPNVVEPRRSILAIGPRRSCCDAAARTPTKNCPLCPGWPSCTPPRFAAGGDSQAHYRYTYLDDAEAQRRKARVMLEHHVWSNADTHGDIVELLQAFDREHPHAVTGRLSRMDRNRYDYEWDCYSSGGPERVRTWELRSHGSRVALCKYVILFVLFSRNKIP